jgi:lysozyme
MPNPMVVDIYHGDAVRNFEDCRQAGIVGVIHKASEAAGYVDASYAERRPRALAAGHLWGAYHFQRPGDVKAQVEHFLAAAKPDDRTLMALDYEVSNVTLDDAREFLHLLGAKLGRRPWLYSGNTIKDKLGSATDGFLGSHRLWLAQYGTRPIVQRSWSKPDLWQYTGDGIGPEPHAVPGISVPGGRGVDLSAYEGSQAQLAIDWVTDRAIEPTNMVPSRDVRWMQMALNRMAGAEVAKLAEDGDIGPKTIARIRSFQTAHGMKVDGVAGPATIAAIEAALAAH